MLCRRSNKSGGNKGKDLKRAVDAGWEEVQGGGAARYTKEYPGSIGKRKQTSSSPVSLL